MTNPHALTIYKASAGSGKTFTLSVEYIKLLIMDPQSYRSTLAVTFTNKATEEMKLRILSQLYGIWKLLPDSKSYIDKIKADLDVTEGFMSERAGIALKNIVHNYSYFRIETIDSFFQSVLRNLARELDLTANLRIELNDYQIERNAVDELIDSLGEKDELLGWIMDYIRENIDDDKKLIESLTGVSADKQWYHNPHVLSAPHDINQEAINSAIEEACKAALAGMKDAKFGFGEGVTYANTNRCYETADGWNQVSNDNGNTDHVLPVLRFEGTDGKPIAILYTVNMASGTLENQMNSEIDPTGRQITCDIAGLSERFVEEYYGGDTVAIYFAGCTGDQWGSVRAEYNYVMGSKGGLEYKKGFFDNEAAWLMLDVASSRLGVSVVDTANAISCGDVHVVSYSNEKFEYKQLDKDKLKSGPDPKVFQYVQSESKPTCTTDVSVFAIDDVAITGVKPEMNIQSLKDIRADSPYAHNIMQNWVSFDGDSVQGYLPDQEGFNQSGKQASKTNFMPGSAEEMVGHAIDMLKESYSSIKK